jgi:hypothetical protein
MVLIILAISLKTTDNKTTVLFAVAVFIRKLLHFFSKFAPAKNE